jgi:hypothetical protein
MEYGKKSFDLIWAISEWELNGTAFWEIMRSGNLVRTSTLMKTTTMTHMMM